MIEGMKLFAPVLPPICETIPGSGRPFDKLRANGFN
jgi:hypothetical protein